MDIYTQLQLNPEAEIPLIAQLTQQITWLIASGELKAGDKLPPIREMAGRLGIHMHTVRLAYQRLEADMLVSIRTRRGTVVLDYDPAYLAENRPQMQSNLIGVMLPAPVPVYNEYLQSVQAAASEHRLLPLICYTYDNPALTEQVINQLIAKQVDGFIVTSISLGSIHDDPSLLEKFPPIVFVDTPDMPGNRIMLDNEGAAYLAVKHLLEHGHRQIGLLTCPLEWANVHQCYRGYQKALSEYGLTPDQALMAEVPNFTQESGYQGALELFQHEDLPQAVFAIADTLALGAIQAANALDIAIPEDIALASYNDIEGAALARPALTTATIPARQMGVQAVELLQNLRRGQKPQQTQITLNTELIIRQSCGCKKI